MTRAVVFSVPYQSHYLCQCWCNSLRPRWNRRHFANDCFKCIFLNENVLILIKISLKFIPKDPINNISALVSIIAWPWPGDKPLSEPMMIISLAHICVTWPQSVNNIVNLNPRKIFQSNSNKIKTISTKEDEFGNVCAKCQSFCLGFNVLIFTLLLVWGYDPLQTGDPRGSQQGSEPLFRQRKTIDLIV